MQTIKFKYGREKITLSLPDSAIALIPRILTEKPPEGKSILAQALEKSEFRLSDYLKSGRNLLIVVPDRTRRCGLKAILPPILSYIFETGIDPQRVKFLIASGTHKRKGIESYIDILGQSVVEKFPVLEHNCDGETLNLSETARGTPVDVNPLLTQTDRILAIGGMLPHYFAGYGGGPKLIIPGCAGRRTIEANHALTIHPDYIYPPGCRPGNIAGNPIIEDIIEAVSFLPRIYHLGIISGEEEKPYRIFAGEIVETYRKMADEAGGLFVIKLDKKADLVIASPGGHPKDIDLLQAHKSLLHASFAVKEGGQIIFFAQCPEGSGSKGLEEIFKLDNIDKVKAELLKRYIMNGLTGLSLFRLGVDFEVYMMTEVKADITDKLGFRKINRIDEIQNLIEAVAMNEGEIVYLPHASLTIAGQD